MHYTFYVNIIRPNFHDYRNEIEVALQNRSQQTINGEKLKAKVSLHFL